MSALSVHVVEVSGPGEAVADQLAAAGLTVSGPTTCATDAGAIEAAIEAAPGADVVLVVGGSGPRGACPEALAALGVRSLPGFGERSRQLAVEVLGAGALGLRVEAGFVKDVLVVGVPDHEELSQKIVAQLLLPALPLLLPASLVSDESSPVATPSKAPLRAAATPTKALSLGLSQPAIAEAPPADEEEAAAARGWLAAVEALKGEIHIGRREDLPQPIECLAPVVNVLNTAGEFGTLRLPSGRRYGLYGWPDLRRPGSKVIAVSWGDPLAEMVVLHRHPHPVGTTIEGDLGLLPPASSGVADACERATGRAPDDTSGRLFALESDIVWILRGRRVVKWDGHRERDDGNPKQVLASLTLRWSNR